MRSPEDAPAQMICWEILPGLPGDGPAPLHFHTGHPRPWSEGLVVKFWNEDGSNWVGNFQRSPGLRPDQVLTWNVANAAIVIASSAFYLINSANPEYYCSLKHITGILIDENRIRNSLPKAFAFVHSVGTGGSSGFDKICVGMMLNWSLVVPVF